MSKYILLFLMIFSFAITGCGYDAEEAIEKCESLVERFCTRSLECGLAMEVEHCVEALDADLMCSEAIGITRNYDQCIDDIETAECSAGTGIPTLPESCNGVILKAN